MNVSTTATTHTARRKTGVCTCCATVISIGQRYEKYRFFGDGPATMTNHPDCARLFRESAYEEWDCNGDDFAELLMESDNLDLEIIRCKDPAVGEAWREIVTERGR